jgi:hypothetical protein
VFEEVPAREPLLELLEAEEVVVAPVFLALARLAGGGGDREVELREPLAQPLDQRPLADPRRPGYDEEAQTFGALAAQIRDELTALPLREAADRLARRDPALSEDPVHLHAPVLRDGEKEIEDLCGKEIFRRIEQQSVDLRTTGFEVSLEGCAPGTDLVCTLQRIHALSQRTLGSRTHRLLRGRLGGGRHAARFYTRTAARQRGQRLFFGNSSRPLPEVKRAWGYLTLFVVLCRAFLL